MSTRKLNLCLILSNPFNPTNPARPAITEVYGKYLPSFGHRIIWITPTYKSGRQIQEDSFNEVKVYTIPHSLSSFLPLKIINFISYYIKEYMFLTTVFNKERHDIIQVRNDVFNAFLALYIRRKYKVPFVFQYSFPKGVYKEQKLEKRYLYLFGKIQNDIIRYILHEADFIFPISKWMEEDLIKEGVPKSKMMPLPMGVNPDLFSFNKSGLNIMKKYCLNNSQILLYIGTMDELRQLSIIIHAFLKVRKYKSNVKLLMVGDGNDKLNLEKLADDLGIKDDVVFAGQVPYFDVPFFIAAADICMCPVPPLSIYKVSSPTKMFEYMACEKPVVANGEIPEQKEVIEESNGGILVKFEAESFANGIIELLDNSNKAKVMGKKGHEWVVKNRSYENMAREVEKKYFELLESYNKER